ncbi:MAG: thioredoxin domain-containing protein [Dehalococcoidia bacterium]
MCVNKEQLALKALEKYPEQVRFEYHPFPYSDFGFKIAEALEGAGDQGKFWELHDAIIENVPKDGAGLVSLMEGVGLDMDKLVEAFTAGKYREIVESSIRKARESGVDQVALFINGKEYQKHHGTFEDLCQAIEQELERLEVDNG